MTSAKRLWSDRAGNHTWDVVATFDGRNTRLDQLTGNATRLWTVETRGAVFQGSAWGSNSQGLVRIGNVPWRQDGDLNGKFYKRLEEVVKRAEKRDVLTAVVLFDGAFPSYFPQGWENHPLNGLGPKGHEYIHSRGPWNVYQRDHVKRVVKTLEPYGNVVYEVGNELHRNSVSSGFHEMVVRWVKRWSDKPVGVSYARGLYQDQSWMTRVGADWIVPNVSPRAGGVRKVSDFRGPQVLDTDHGWALRSNVAGLKRGHSLGMPVLLMDGMDGYILRNQGSLSLDRAWINQVT